MARKKGGRRAAKAQPKRKRAAAGTRKSARSARKTTRKTASRSARRSAGTARKPAAARSKKPAARAVKKAARPAPRKQARRRSARPPGGTSRAAAPAVAPPPRKSPRLDRQRRVLREEHGIPSSLDLDRRGSAARTGREEIGERRRDHASMTPGITAGDVDASVENAYFSGEEAPGGDTPTPDQDVVEEIGQALGIQYQDNEELKGGDEVAERDRHRWELDPASAEDYRDRSTKE